MIDLTNKKVKIYLKSGLNAEGIVLEHTDTDCILSNENNQNLFIINNPAENIEAFIIIDINNMLANKSFEPEIKSPNSYFQLPPVDLEKIPKPEKYTDLNLLELAELKKLQREGYLKRLQKELNKKETNPDGGVQYSLPSFFFKEEQ